MLVDHPEPQQMGGARMLNGVLVSIDQNSSGIGAVIAHEAFDERALAGTVFAEQRMHAAGTEFRGHLMERAHGRKALAEIDNFDLGWGDCLLVAHREIDSSLGAPARVRVREEL